MATSTARASISPSPSSRTARTGPRASKPDDVAGQHRLGAEARGLGDRAVGEVRAGEALRGSRGSSRSRRSARPVRRVRRARRPRCAAPRTRRTPPPPGRPGRRRRCTGRRAAARRRVRSPSASASSSVRGRAQRLAVGDQHERQVVGAGLRELDQGVGLLVALHVEPPVGHVVAGEERLHLVAAVRPPVADHPDLRLPSGAPGASARAGRRPPGRAAPPAGPTA